MVYAVGNVNVENDNMYSVDMVKKSVFGYKWLGGGSHINRDIPTDDKDFILSAQLLNENQNIDPTLFGIITDERIHKVTIKTKDGLSESILYNGKVNSEKLYVTQFINNVSEYNYFMFIITFNDGTRIEYIISDEEIARFQKGHQIYFYKNT